MDVTLPRLAEGADSGTVVNVVVTEGDQVQLDQTLLELENEKAVAPIPSPGVGRVARIHVQVGQVVSVGQVLVTIDEGRTAESAKPPVPDPEPPVALEAEVPASPVPGVYVYVSSGGAPPPAAYAMRINP